MSWGWWIGLGLVVAVLVACAPGGGSAPAGASAAQAPVAEAGAAPAPERVVLALPVVSGVFVPHVLAQRQGFFRAEGLEVELPVMRTNLVIAALSSGEADYNGMFSPTVRAILSGVPQRVLAAVVDKSTRQLVAVPGIQTVEQLRGKAIAVTQIGGGPYNSGVLAIEHAGLDPQTDVTWLAIGGTTERLLAMQQGAAQASIFSGSEILRAEALGFVSLLRLDEVAPLPESGLATSEQKLAMQREQVKRMLRALVRALQYIKRDREGSLPVFMEFLSLSREEAEQAYAAMVPAYSDDGTVSERALRFTIEAEKKDLKLTADVPADRVADFGPLYEVLGELGLTPAAGRAR
ncbi:MAG TPA: ABC transporter substrate-binding protein [Chloroflexota bacterium]|nr:ABC transporter substrate-binding protein [Chloroflexota bacterium]